MCTLSHTNCNIYTININLIKNNLETAFSLITAGRQNKAMKLKFEDDRLRCIAAGVLLHKFCGVTDDSQISYNQYGKPFIKGIEFNISHGGDYAVIALSDTAVGIDIQPVGEYNHKVAERVFCKSELEWVQFDKIHHFYELWTRKESISKAVGKGFKIGFKGINCLPVSTTPREIDDKQYCTDTLLFDNHYLSVTVNNNNIIHKIEHVVQL